LVEPAAFFRRIETQPEEEQFPNSERIASPIRGSQGHESKEHL